MKKNKFLEELLNHRDTVVLLDTNFFISPRNVKEWDFDRYWVSNLLDIFSGFVLHESVREEMISSRLLFYRDKIRILYDKDLNINEIIKYQAAYKAIKVQLNVGFSKKFKNVGEAKTLAYMYAKGINTIISRDSDVINNINRDSIRLLFNGEYGVIHFYELLYVLRRLNRADSKILKAFYKAFYPNGIKTDNGREYLKFSDLVITLDSLYGNSVLKMSLV